VMKKADEARGRVRYFSLALAKDCFSPSAKTEETKPAAQACCQFRELVGMCVPFGGRYKGSGKKALTSAGGPTTAPMQLM
jgi:hypothetical protein